jgi:hypothetical protein
MHEHNWPDELDQNAECSNCWLPYSEWDGTQECRDDEDDQPLDEDEQ